MLRLGHHTVYIKDLKIPNKETLDSESVRGLEMLEDGDAGGDGGR